MPMKDKILTINFKCKIKKNQKCLERARMRATVCTHGDVLFLFIVVVVVLIMIPVTLHCYNCVQTLHEWVQFTNEETKQRNLIKTIFFYHILSFNPGELPNTLENTLQVADCKFDVEYLTRGGALNTASPGLWCHCNL